MECGKIQYCNPQISKATFSDMPASAAICCAARRLGRSAPRTSPPASPPCSAAAERLYCAASVASTCTRQKLVSVQEGPAPVRHNAKSFVDLQPIPHLSAMRAGMSAAPAAWSLALVAGPRVLR
jgi:hypothetical protein